MRYFKFGFVLLLPALLLFGFTPNDNAEAPPQNQKVYFFVYATTTCDKGSHFFVSHILHDTPANFDTERKNFERKVRMKYPKYTIAAGCEKPEGTISPKFYSRSECAQQLTKTFHEGRNSSATAHKITW